MISLIKLFKRLFCKADVSGSSSTRIIEQDRFAHVLKNGEENPQKEEVVEITKEQNTVIEIHAINNRSGQEYVYRSENDFGLDWSTVDGWLHIWQCLSEKENHGIAIACLVDFSLVKIIRKEAVCF